MPPQGPDEKVRIYSKVYPETANEAICDKAASAASCRILWRAIHANILASPHDVAGIGRKEIELMQPFVRRFSFFATLLLGLAAVASAQDPGACANVSLAGAWGWIWTGTFILSTGAVPAAGAGISVCDADGNCTTTQTSSVGGNVGGQETGKGVWKLNPDCTGTATVTIYDASGNVSREATWFRVMDDNGKEFRGIMTSLQRGGANVPVIVTMTGRRAVASAQDGPTCSLAGVAGQWGWTVTGTLYQATGPAAIARVGTTTADAEGNFSATLTASTGGRVSELAMKGTWTVNPDCTGTMTLGVYDASGNLVAPQTWNIVFDDNERELRAILTSVVIGGTSTPVVATMTGRRVSPIDEIELILQGAQSQLNK